MSSDATDEGVYVIQFNDYKKNLPKSLKQFYDANLFSDAEIITMDGGCFSVHRVVLSANSPFFLKVFTKSNRVNASGKFYQNHHFTYFKKQIKYSY